MTQWYQLKQNFRMNEKFRKQITQQISIPSETNEQDNLNIRLIKYPLKFDTVVKIRHSPFIIPPACH